MMAAQESPAMADATPPRSAEIQGLVDNATATRLFGWAWNAARPEERVQVDLRLGEETVATTCADRDRHDLAKAGIGDGHHAFELPLKPEWVERRAELSVVVRTADGSEGALALRVRRADVDPTGSLQRVLEATAAAHRQLRLDLERIASRLPESGPGQAETLRALAVGQGALLDRLDTLTLWLARLDERMAALPAQAPVPRPRRRLEAWEGVLAGVVVLVLLGAGFATCMLAGGVAVPWP